MKKKCAIILTLIFSVMCAGWLQAVQNDSFPSTAAYGGGMTGDAVNAFAPQYNPGGLGLIKNYEIQLSHLSWIFNTSYEELNAVFPTRFGGIGISTLFFHSFFDNTDLLYSIGQPGTKLDDYTLTLIPSIGIEIVKNLGIGAGLTINRWAYSGASANSMSLNVGAFYRMRLLSRIFKFSQNSRHPVDYDLSFGASLYDIYTLNDNTNPMSLRFGVSAQLFPFLKILLDSKFILGSGYYQDSNLMAGAEYSMDILFTRLFIRAGMDIIKQKLNCGAGIQMNLGGTFYKLDIAYNLADASAVTGDFSKNTWLTLTIGQNPALLKYIGCKNYFLSDEIMNIRDEITLKEQKTEDTHKDVRQTAYKLRMGEITTSDDTILKKKYEKEMAQFIKDRLASQSNIRFVQSGEDILLTGVMSKEGELLLFKMDLDEGGTGRLLQRSSFEKTVSFQRDDVKNYDTVDFLITAPDQISFVEKNQGTAIDQDLAVVNMIATNAASTIADGLESILSAEYSVFANTDNVDVYVDGDYKGRMGADKQLKFDVRSGRHKLSCLKENSPKKEFEIEAHAGIKTRVDVEMLEGVFNVGLEVRSAPNKVRVSLDGKFLGETPLNMSNVKNGKHVIQYVDKLGLKWSENVNFDHEGTYRIFALNRFADSFKSLNDSFWNVVGLRKGWNVSARDKLLNIGGSSSEAEWNPAGLISRSFKAGKLVIEADVRVQGDDYFAMIGLLDRDGNSMGLGLDRKYFQYFESGKESRKMVPAVDFKEKSVEHHLKLTYDQNGSMELTVDNLNLGERSWRLGDHLRVVILSGSEKQSGSSELIVKNLSIKNE